MCFLFCRNRECFQSLYTLYNPRMDILKLTHERCKYMYMLQTEKKLET